MRQHRGVAITLWLLLILICILIIGRTQFSADLSAFMPSQPTANQQVFIDQLQSGVAARLILVGIEGSNIKTVADISRKMSRQLRTMQEFVSINNGEPIDSEHQREFIFTHRYQLSPAVNLERFTTTGLHDAIEESIALLASPAGLLVKPLFARDPTGEMVQLLDLFNSGTGPRTFNDIWVSQDGGRAILLAQTSAAGSDTDGQQRAISLIQQAFDHVIKENNTATIKLLMTGPGVFSVTSRDAIKKEVMRLSIFSTLIIVTLLFLIYRSFTAVLLGTLPVLTGIAVGIAAVSLGFGMVHGVTLGFGITLIGEAIDYSLYLFLQSKHHREERSKQDWLTSFWPTIRLGVLTSIIGFAALLFSGFPGLAQLGLYSTAGLIAAALVTRFVLPALLPRNFHVRDVSHFGAIFSQISHHAIPLRWLTAAVVLIAGTVIYTHHDNIWNSDLSALSPISNADRALDTSLRDDLGAANPRYFVIVSAHDRASAIVAAEEIATKLEPLIAEGIIAGYNSPSHYLPSIATQNRRLAALPDMEELTKRLQAATAELPIRAARLTGFLNDAQSARQSNPVLYSDLAGTSMALAIDALLIDHGERWSALLPLRIATIGTGITAIERQRIRAALTESDHANALFVDVKEELDQMYSGYLSEVLYLSLSGLGAILVLLLIALRSPIRTLRVVLPLILAVTVVTAGLVWCGYRLTILHLIGLLLTVAIGSNYALFFDQKSHVASNAGRARTLASLLFANTTTVTVFTLLAFSSVPVLQNIGMTVAPGVVLALLFSAILAKRTKSHRRLA